MKEKAILRRCYKLKGHALEVAYSLILRNRSINEAVFIGLNAAAIKEGTACPWFNQKEGPANDGGANTTT